MTPEEIQKCIHDGITKALADQLPLAVSVAVNASVNGKVQAMRDDLRPITEAYSKWLSWKRVGVIVFGVVLAVGGFIQSVHVLWRFAVHYVVLK